MKKTYNHISITTPFCLNKNTMNVLCCIVAFLTHSLIVIVMVVGSIPAQWNELFSILIQITRQIAALYIHSQYTLLGCAKGKKWIPN